MTRPRAFTLALGALMVVASACGTQIGGSGTSPSPATPTPSPASSSPTASTTPTPTPSTDSGPRRVYWEDLEPRMCLDTRKLDNGYDYWVVPCTAKHDREVLANTTLEGPTTWPGERAVDKLADTACRAAFKKYVGVSYDNSHLELEYLAAVKEDWQEGVRTSVCLVFDPDHKTISHTLKGSRE